MPQTKLHFDVDQKGTTLKPEERQARALEYIAHYLDLIEGHLAKLGGEGASFGQIGQALTELVRQRAKK